MKLGNYRAQSYTIAQRKVYETGRQADSSIRRFTNTEMLPDGSKKEVDILKIKKGDS